MIHVLIFALVPILLVVFLKTWHDRRIVTPIAEDPDSAEVFRGPTDAARKIISGLAAAGINAWIEARDGDNLVVHVEQEVLPQIPALMEVAKHQAQQQQQQTNGAA